VHSPEKGYHILRIAGSSESWGRGILIGVFIIGVNKLGGRNAEMKMSMHL
jgi:hypothetical protein